MTKIGYNQNSHIQYDEKHYFLNYQITADKDSIMPGPRIISFEATLMNVEGAYNSLDELKRQDVNYQNLKKENLKRAELIIQDKFILKIQDFILVKDHHKQPPNLDYFLLMHTLSGNRYRKSYTGLHYIKRPYPDWIAKVYEIDTPDKNGVWQAKIIINNNEKLLHKKDKSSLFPSEWSFERVYDECIYALNTKTQKSQYLYESQTKCGIPVTIVYNDNGDFKSIYPIYQKRD